MNLCPSLHMQNKLLESGWKVIKKFESDPSSTGGTFSVPYLVEKDSQKAFMKVINFSSALEKSDFMKEVQTMSTAYNFEKDVLNICNFNNLDKIVKLIYAGQEQIDGYMLPASYIIFEIANNGDIRKFMDTKSNFDLAWILRSLHHATIGMSQLHQQGIAHQDIKPSNVLVFDGNESKIADFGRAIVKGKNSPHENAFCAGDLGYAPIEILYGHISDEWSYRRLGSDLYLLGSLVMFYFTKTGVTAQIKTRLAPHHRPYDFINPSNPYWKGTYAEVYPYVEDAFYKTMNDFSNTLFFKEKHEIVKMVSELCHPEVSKRGHPLERTKAGNQFSLQRYISLLDLLAAKAEYEFKKEVKNEFK